MCTIQHDAAALNALGQGENLYCGFGDGCMTKTIPEHMEIGEFLLFKGFENFYLLSLKNVATRD